MVIVIKIFNTVNLIIVIYRYTLRLITDLSRLDILSMYAFIYLKQDYYMYLIKLLNTL